MHDPNIPDSPEAAATADVADMDDAPNASDAPPFADAADAVVTSRNDAAPAGADPAVIVRFRVPGQTMLCRTDATAVRRHDTVIVQTDAGPTPATVLATRPLAPSQQKKPLPRVLRLANDQDAQAMERNHIREKEAFQFCKERIRALGLPMKLVAVEIAHSGNRAVFNFSSAERVDFRALVKELARRFHTRIEMRQIGVRDAARHTGGIGICGQRTCCSTFLPEFKPISIRMAKDQNLSLNHQKLSGVCGRLRCCLQYEQATYQESRKGLPKIGKRVMTPEGDGRVKDVDVLRRRVRVQLTAGGFADVAADDIVRLNAAGQPEHASPTPQAPTARAKQATDGRADKRAKHRGDSTR